ncbi:hypothetical protein LY76DRAFT_48082 [Colletotrichum caudatum]|nr:hypothetical protein LY76DRAFT_48082 [Colletotrichum caudatum]
MQFSSKAEGSCCDFLHPPDCPPNGMSWDIDQQTGGKNSLLFPVPLCRIARAVTSLAGLTTREGDAPCSLNGIAPLDKRRGGGATGKTAFGCTDHRNRAAGLFIFFSFSFVADLFPFRARTPPKQTLFDRNKISSSPSYDDANCPFPSTLSPPPPKKKLCNRLQQDGRQGTLAVLSLSPPRRARGVMLDRWNVGTKQRVELLFRLFVCVSSLKSGSVTNDLQKRRGCVFVLRLSPPGAVE